MKFALLVLAGNLPSITCATISGYLALNEKPGWGWFLFGAILLHASFKTKEKIR